MLLCFAGSLIFSKNWGFYCINRMNREQSALFRPDFYANKRTSQVLYGPKYYNKQLFTDKKLNQLKDWFRIGLYKSKAEMIYSEHHAEIVKPEQNV